ncbi:MAG: LysM peptidoglycan-binding domain-containing protein, partial [Tissierellaceae bacterium]
VESGDVLWKIARKFGKTWQELAEYNEIKNPHLIFPGQVILVP